MISSPKSFFADRGGLHDARIKAFRWDASARLIVLEVADLDANALGLPEYMGPKPGTITFREVEALAFSCDAFADDIQRVYDVEIEEIGSGTFRCVLLISPSGRLEFVFSSAAMEEHR
ncbi:hypothetical protein [Variovorax sp. KK3]|uniref:hypothetical protein n=1 Tax=Variovorax sp. KK3 TaxID=1855728 RepID=UPI0015C3D468|nr:hypothetical protein [Variovorax sp. KK3]